MEEQKEVKKMAIPICGNHTVKDYLEFCIDDQIPERFTLTFMTNLQIGEYKCELCGKPAVMFFRVEYASAKHYTSAEWKILLEDDKK